MLCACDFPAGSLREPHNPAIDITPALGAVHHEFRQMNLKGAIKEQELDYNQRDKYQKPKECIEHDQGARNQTQEWSRKKI